MLAETEKISQTVSLIPNCHLRKANYVLVIVTEVTN